MGLGKAAKNGTGSGVNGGAEEIVVCLFTQPVAALLSGNWRAGMSTHRVQWRRLRSGSEGHFGEGSRGDYPGNTNFPNAALSYRKWNLNEWTSD